MNLTLMNRPTARTPRRGLLAALVLLCALPLAACEESAMLDAGLDAAHGSGDWLTESDAGAPLRTVDEALAMSRTPGALVSPTAGLHGGIYRGPRFDGRPIGTPLVQSLAQAPIVAWEHCTDADGAAFDDCLIVTEQETGETMRTRLLSADACTTGSYCHGGYAVLAETTLTYEDATAVGSRGGIELLVSGGLRMLHVRELRFGSRAFYFKTMRDVVTFDGSMRISRGYQEVAIDLLDANGTPIDFVGWMMTASMSGAGATDCEQIGAAAETVTTALGDALTGVVQAAQVVAGGVIGGVGGFVLTVETGPGAVVGAAAGLAAGAGVGALLHTPTEKIIGAGTSAAALVTSTLATALCEEFSDASDTTHTDFEPGDDTPRDREPVEEGRCDLGYYWGESCTERTVERSWSTSEEVVTPDGELEIVVTSHSETVTVTECEWMCIPI